MNQVTVFKIRIDSVSETKIGFELFVGDRVADTYVNVLARGGYGIKNGILLTPKEFTDFATRLIAYVYTTRTATSDESLKILWNLKLNIFDHEAQKLSISIFNHIGIRDRLIKLDLIKEGKK